MRPKLRLRRAGHDAEGVGNIDVLIARLADRQRGVVSRAQLLEAGVEGTAVKRRVRSGRLHPLHRGVYLVGHRVLPRGAREVAALLACGPRAALSHRSAAYLWKLLPYPANPTPVDITVAGRDPCDRPGIRSHRVRVLDRRDLQRRDGIPVTSPARTLLDLAASAAPAELDRAFAEAQVLRLVDVRGLADQIERNPRRSGGRSLRRLIDSGPALTRSEAERRLLRLVGEAGLPRPRVNARVGGYEVDFLWPEHKLVVEVDGYAFHRGRDAFERDRQRDAALAALGYTVVRITWRQLVAEPHAVIARISAALAVRRR